MTRSPSDWPAAAAATKDVCLACHRVHGTKQTGLFRMGHANDVPGADAVCVACHPSTAPRADSSKSLVHPGPVTSMPAPTTLPVSTAPAGKTLIGCLTCHDPHQSGDHSATAALLRTGTKESKDGLCLSCHRQMATIASIGHTPGQLQAAGFDGTACQPCHVIHTNPNAIEKQYLWPDWLLEQAASSPLNLAADRYCVACHRQNGPVAPPTVATHPPMPMFNLVLPGQPGFLPLFDEKGQVSPYGSIACRTCHVTHGREEAAAVPQEMRTLDPRELRAREWHLRDFDGNSVCTVCHGPAGLYRFLYFHEPQQRRAGEPG